MFGFSLSGTVLLFGILILSLQYAEVRIASVFASHSGLVVSVVDDTAVPLASAIVQLSDPESGWTTEGVTDSAGRVRFDVLSAATCTVRAEKKGYYPAVLDSVTLAETDLVEISLLREQELSEQVDVVYSSARIDPNKTASTEEMSSSEILRAPFPATRDIRNVLPLMAGAVQGPGGQIYFNGAPSSQTEFRLDGFKIGNPATGLFDSRVSADAVRAIQVQSARYSAEFGGASGGVVNLVSGTGDDRFRFAMTDFIPSIQSRKGIHLNNWTPRLTLSGPVAKGKAWFYHAMDGELGLDLVEELPEGADRNSTWRVSSLSKVQVSIGRSHVLTGTWLFNQFRADHAGLTALRPSETTVDQRRRAYLIGVRDLSYLGNGMLLELSFGANANETEDRPMGRLPYELQLERTRGNFYRAWDSRARRFQLAGSVTLPRRGWLGKHELKIGAEADRTTYLLNAERRPIRVYNPQNELLRKVAFSGLQEADIANSQMAGFVQDRWNLSDRLLLELGLRWDWDEIVQDVLWSPRIAASYLVSPRSRLLVGVGHLHDATNLDLLARARTGPRFDTFYSASILATPVRLDFAADQSLLRAPTALSWNAGWERQFPDLFLLNLELSGRDGRNGWHYSSRENDGSGRLFALSSSRTDTFRSLKVAVSRVFKAGNTLSASYTLASARSSDVLEPDIDSVMFTDDPSGPLPWDTPRRVLSWGWFPLTRSLQLSYSADWRTGFPFHIVDENQDLIGKANSRRFPDYFSLNLHLEKRFRLGRYEWAFRGGFNNLTGRPNASVVNNNIDSPSFLTYSGVQERAFVGRIRFVGRK